MNAAPRADVHPIDGCPADAGPAVTMAARAGREAGRRAPPRSTKVPERHRERVDTLGVGARG
ncbi:hypothetical protein DVS28_a1303 [Euzebya pacifica]|uniref:Uncharacterized protein n=1 Tax=Euzebya pacifica TaxID=1608957 RepID=A0A346XUV5_9ACTN|nr:hypothetical protein DVS28_a1303 [Euzebya pacifica]